MFKWLVKTWKIWRLNRKWYEVYYHENTSDLQMIKVCFGRRLCQIFAGAGHTYVVIRKTENEWYRLKRDDSWTGQHCAYSSKAVEQRYQEYLSELEELTLL
jgi:hypothetical protein